MFKLIIWPKRAFAVFLLTAAAAIALPAQTFTSLHSFDGADGQRPWYYSALVQATDGNFYGTTYLGGANVANCTSTAEGCGTVFKITPGGTLTTIYSFCSLSNCTDGANPTAGLVQAADGNLYGTTNAGGSLGGVGTVFRITLPLPPSGTSPLTTLYSFCDLPEPTCGPGGTHPQTALIKATDGNLYGTTSAGGVPTGDCGTAFQITTSGVLTYIYSFGSQPNVSDGCIPSGLFQAIDGNFYGTTNEGGLGAFNSDAGIVFKLSFPVPPSESSTLTTLYNFCNQTSCHDGADPTAGLVQATDGNLYGAAYSGGTGGNGTVFEIPTSGGTLTTLYNFCLNTCANGSTPFAGLIQATDGNLYGTTLFGGASGNGTLYKITTSGALTTLYSFCSEAGCADGQNPYAGLIQATNGTQTLYGTTADGGAYGSGSGDGTVFSLLVPQTARVSPGSLSFSGQDIGTTSAPKNVTLTNTSANRAPINPPVLTFTGADPGDFAVSSNGCTAPLIVRGDCVISVTFSPAGSGKRTATLTITDGASDSPQNVSLTGSGLAPDFSISASPSSVTVTHGQSVQTTLTVTPLNGSTQTIALTCAGGPRNSSCSIVPPSVTLDGVHSQTPTLTIDTAATTPTGVSKVSAKGTSGSDVHSVAVTVTVN